MLRNPAPAALSLLAATTFLSTACGKASAPDPDWSRARSSSAAAPLESRSASKDHEPPAPAAQEDSTAGRALAPAPAAKVERPGLGTEWGETRHSRVSSAPFEREDWNVPLTTTTFFYNDEVGVRALLGADFRERHTDGVSAARGAITVRVVDDHGAPLPTFSSGGRRYVMGNDGARYSLRIENRSSARFEAVTTVDGLDVIDGQPGSFEKRGYLLDPWSTVEIDGFRRSEEEVAAFRFGRVRDSYAAKRGHERNVGVIGVAVFQERGAAHPWTQRELEHRDSADAFPGRFAPAP